MNIYHMSYIRSFLGETMAMLYFRGCNFSCQECLRKRDEGNIYAEETEYIRWDLEGIFSFLEEIGPARVYLEGYEPTMDPDLPEIAHRVSSLPAQVTLMTNGSLLTDGYARELIRSGVRDFIIGVKAFDPGSHLDYTGESRDKVLDGVRALASIDDLDFSMQVETVLLPGVNDPGNVVDLARFLSGLDPSISLFIEPFIPNPESRYREPNREELIRSVAGAMEHLYLVSYHPLHSEIESMRRSPRRAVFVDVRPEGERKG